MTSSAKTVVRITSPADILGVLPHRIGFQPTESVVLLCLHGPRRRDGVVMRMDLAPHDADPDVAADMAARAAVSGATGAIVVVYTDSPDDEPMGLPRRGLVAFLIDALKASGATVPEALLVRDGRWWSYLCDDDSCCPATGSALPQEPTPAAAHYAAEAVAEGAVVLPDRVALVRTVCPPRNPDADLARRQARKRAVGKQAALLDGGDATALRDEAIPLLRSLRCRWADGSRELSVDEAAQAVCALSVKAVRDEAVTMLLDADPRPFVELLSALARHADDEDAPGVCTALAWVAYAAGNGAMANIALERALHCDPGYEMAHLIDEALAGMVPPKQVRRITRDVRLELRRGS